MQYPNVQLQIQNCVAAGLWPPSLVYRPVTCYFAWVSYCVTTATPCYEHWKTKVMGHPKLWIYSTTAMANPVVMKGAPLSLVAMRTLLEPFYPCLLSKSDISELIEEAPRYYIKCEALNWDPDMKYEDLLPMLQQFWVTHKSLTAWRKFAHICFLLQPSSACVERVFSVLKYVYTTDQQSTMLIDMLETIVMLRHNRRSTNVFDAVVDVDND
jgi:hypothetical protein